MNPTHAHYETASRSALSDQQRQTDSFRNDDDRRRRGLRVDGVSRGDGSSESERCAERIGMRHHLTRHRWRSIAEVPSVGHQVARRLLSPFVSETGRGACLTRACILAILANITPSLQSGV